ncbi:MAG: hypothetical protein VB126_07725 [Paludibacter sp.]|nr:hypothetical protein [Paludibacter sp.]
MNAFFKKSIYLILFLPFAFFLSNCVSDEYDLSDGVNTEMTIGGDSLSVPIGKTKPIVLGDMIDSLGVDLIEKSANGTYSIRVKDSVGVNITAINPVSVSVAPITIQPIATNVANIVFPVIQLDPVTVNSAIDVPVANTNSLNLPVIESSYYDKVTITKPAGVRGNQNSTTAARSKAAQIQFGPYEVEGGKSVTQSIDFTYDNILKKINKIYFKSNTVTVSFNKSEIKNAGFDSYEDKIVRFSIEYSSEFELSDATGAGARIEGNKFIIENSVLPDQNVVNFTYKVKSLNLSNVPQSGKLNYATDIPYSVRYSLTGRGDENSNVIGKQIGVNVTLSAAPALDDLDIETNPIVLTQKTGNSAINEVVGNLPDEVDVVNTLNFKDGAALKLNIANPGISPFTFSNGSCVVNLPKMFVFKAYPGLDLGTNVLTIPYAQLFGEKTIGISGIKLNKKVTNQAITVTDNFSYNVTNLTVAGSTTKLSTTQSLGTKNLNVTSSTVGLDVKDATVTTKNITINIPTQSTDFKINQFVSADVKKINKVTLKTPASITLKIDVANLPAGIDSLFFRNYTIKLPASMKFKTGDVNVNNEVIINRGFKVSEGFTKVLTLESFDFGATGLTLTNGNFVLNEKIDMSGSAYIKSSSINSSSLGNVTVQPKITIGTMPIAQIEGQVAPKIDPVSEVITLDIPDMLKSGDNNLDIQNPVITLEIGNTMGIPLDLALSLIPKRNGVAIPNSTITTTVSVAAATTIGEFNWSKFWLSKKNEGVTTGYTSVIVANLSDMLKTFPDEIEVKAVPTITGTNHKVDLYSKKNALNVKYSVNVPFDFGQNFKIQYRDTISDLQKDLSDYLDYANKIDIVAVVSNEIPMDLALSLVPLDISNKVIPGITVNVTDKIKSCDLNGNAQVSLITLGIQEVQEGALSKLNAFDYRINASKNSTVAGIPLKASQTVSIELRVKVPGGITIDPGE